MGKFFDKMVYGNPNKKDFTKADLPKNRFDLFFDVLKVRLLGLITVNLLYLLFALPLILFLLFSFYAISSQYSVTGLTSSEFINLINTTLLICIPLLVLTGPAQAGMTYVIRNWSWGENASPWKDFWKEFKRSWGKAVIYNLFCGLFIYAVWFWLSTMYLSTSLSGYITTAVFALMGVLALVFLFMNVYVYPLLVTFNLNLKKILKNALIFSLLQLPRTFVFILGIVLLAVLVFALPAILSVLMLVIGFAFIALAQMVYSNFVFDKYIRHITNEEVPTRRGMAPLDAKSSEKEDK